MPKSERRRVQEPTQNKVGGRRKGGTCEGDTGPPGTSTEVETNTATDVPFILVGKGVGGGVPGPSDRDRGLLRNVVGKGGCPESPREREVGRLRVLWTGDGGSPRNDNVSLCL